MRRRAWSRGAVLSLGMWASLSCTPYYAAPRSTSASAAATSAPPLADRLAELADALDPGPQPPLSAGLAPWIAEAIGLPSPPPAGAPLAEAIAGPIDAWDQLRPGVDDEGRVAAVVGLARAVVLAEQQLAGDEVAIDTLLALERAYAALARPQLSQQAELLARYLGVFAQTAAARGFLDDQRKLPELFAVVRAALLGASALHRATVARILRHAPEHPQVTEILARAARNVGPQGGELAVGAMRLSVELREPRAMPTHYLALAEVCYEALELACGNEALGWAAQGRGQGTPGLQARFADVERLQALVTEAGSLADRADVEARVRRGEIYLELQRWDDAESVFRSLHRQHPRDARAVTGLARHAIASRADFHAAYQLIERSDANEHRDRAYFEIAIGTRATTIVQDVLPRVADGGIAAAIEAARPYVAKLRSDVLAYEELGADDAVVLHFVLDRLEEVAQLLQAGKADEIRPRARALLPQVAALQAAVPKNRHAYRLLLAAASLSSDAKAAFAVVDAPLPALGEHQPAAAVRRAEALLDLSIAWERFERLDDVQRYAAEAGLPISDPRMRRLLGHVAAVRARVTGNAEAWIAAEAAYRASAADPEAPAAVLHNLGVVMHELGQPAKAKRWWGKARTRVDDDLRDVVRLHDVVGESAPAFVDVEPFALSSDQDLALLALQWAVHVARPADVSRMRKALAKATAQARRDTLRPSVAPGPAGVLLKGALSFNLGYHSRRGLELVLDVVTTPWLVLTPPR